MRLTLPGRGNYMKCNRRGYVPIKASHTIASDYKQVSWGSLHKEWESGEEKARGKILMLYSPDTKLFKELQEALKSFLELACHCDIYDLFDDALFDTIALDPR